MNLRDIKTGMRVTSAPELRGTAGMLVARAELDARRPNTPGVIVGMYPGHGGDLWAVRHEDGSVAAYMYSELEG